MDRIYATLDSLLKQLEFIKEISDQIYTKTNEIAPSSIGGHVKHSLDHLLLLLDSYNSTWIVHYDLRIKPVQIGPSDG